MQPPDQTTIRVRRVHAVVNPASGGVGPGAAGELAALFAGLGLRHEVSVLAPDQFERTVRAAVDAGPDVVVVLGGDGTARLAAELCGPDGPLVAPLAAGTMNKLGRVLYGTGPWRDALADILQGGVARWVCGGAVEGRAFFCSAVLGSPALLAQAREAIRSHSLRRAWRRAMLASRKTFVSPLRYACDGQAGQGQAIAFICPTVSRALTVEADALETAVLDLPGARAGVRLALSNLLGDWRDDPGVTVRICRNARVRARHPIPAMLDGEFFRLGRQVGVEFRPRAFRALAPDARSGDTHAPPTPAP